MKRSPLIIRFGTKIEKISKNGKLFWLLSGSNNSRKVYRKLIPSIANNQFINFGAECAFDIFSF